MARRGFTLIEVMISLVLLTVVLLGLASSMGAFVKGVANADRSAAAATAADDRIAAIQLHPNYGTVDSVFTGSESNLTGLPGFTRTTSFVRVGGAGQANNYKRVTVSVSGPGLTTPVSRTVTVAAP